MDLESFIKADPNYAILAIGMGILGGAINRIIMNRRKIEEIKLSTEQKHFKLTLDEASDIRKELRESVAALNADLSAWKTKYYNDMTALKEENLKLGSDVAALKVQLTDIRARGWIPDEFQAYYR